MSTSIEPLLEADLALIEASIPATMLQVGQQWYLFWQNGKNFKRLCSVHESAFAALDAVNEARRTMNEPEFSLS